MRPRLSIFLLLSNLIFCLAAAPYQGNAPTATPAPTVSPTPTVTPAPVPPAFQEGWSWLVSASQFYGLPNVILILFATGIGLFLLALGRGILKKSEGWGENLPEPM